MGVPTQHFVTTWTFMGALFSGMKAQIGSVDGLRAFVRSVFDQFDEDNSNNIDAEEFRNLCIELGYYFSPDELATVFAIIDTDHSGTIEFEEFWTFWLNSEKFQLTDTRKLELYRAAIGQFRQYDLDGNGKISCDEYRELARRGNWGKTDEQINEAMKKLDTDGDGEISFDEFVAWLNWGL